MSLFKITVGWTDVFLAAVFFAWLSDHPIITGGPDRPVPADTAVMMFGWLIANAVAVLWKAEA